MISGRKKRKWNMWRNAFLLVAPFTLLYLLFFIYPTWRILQLSLYDAQLIGGEPAFIGLENYRDIWEDALFWRSVRNTLYFVLLTVIPNTALGLVFALMVVRLKRLRSMVLAAFFLPYILPVSVVTLIFQWIFDSQFGVAQIAFQRFFNENIAVFANPNWAMPMIAFVTIWWTVGFNMLLFIAGLQSIGKDYYDAADLDGANNLQKFLYITWPLLWPITTLVLTLQLILQLKIFDQVFLLTGGGPFNSTIVVLLYMYRQAFTRFDGGYSSTIAVALFVLILIAAIFQVRILRSGRST